MSDQAFQTDRPGSGGAPIIARFKLTSTLSPGSTATARLVSYGGNPGAYFSYSDESYTLSDPHYRFFGMTDEYCWAKWESDSESWEMLSMEGCLVRHARVYTSVTALGTGTVKLYRWDPDTLAEVDTGLSITVRDFRNKTWAVGDRVFVYYEPKSRSWYIIGAAGSELTYFELTADLVFGVNPGADNAAELQWDGAAYQPTGGALRVFDWTILGSVDSAFWVGRAPAGAVKGYRGLATSGPSGRLEIVWMEEQARFIKFQLNAQLKYNVASGGATLLDYFDGRKPPVGTITVTNVVTATAGVYEFYGPANAVGYAVWNDASEYRILWLETQAKKIEFTLASASAGTAAFSAGSSVSPATVNNYWDGKNPGGTVTIQDPQGLFSRALQGGKGIAVWNEQYDGGNGGYTAIACQSKAGYIDFTLTNAMAGSSSSSAATVNDYGGAGQDVQNPGSTAAVYDDQGLWKYAPVGAKGRAIYDAIEDKYRIVSCQLKRPWLRGTVTGSTLTISLSWGPGVAVSGTVTVVNHGSFFTITGGEEAKASYAAESDEWILDWVECP